MRICHIQDLCYEWIDNYELKNTEVLCSLWLPKEQDPYRCMSLTFVHNTNTSFELYRFRCLGLKPGFEDAGGPITNEKKIQQKQKNKKITNKQTNKNI